MSSRVLRKQKPRAAAKAVNYEDTEHDSDDDLLIQPPRKQPRRTSTRIAESASSSKEASSSKVPQVSVDPGTPDEEDNEPEAATSADVSRTPSEAPTPSVTPSDAAQPSRKVRLRLTRKQATPEEEEEEAEQEEEEVGGEDEEEVDGEAEDESEAESESEEATPAAATSSTKANAPMTARQAALAGLGTDNRLLTLDELDLGRRKGPQKTEEELAEKRREAAKRRKAQLEQKTKEEKEGAVDRLLNKQAPRPRAKRNQSMPGTGAAGTPSGYATPVRGRRVEDADAGTRSTSPDGDDSNSTESYRYIPPPTTIRWISTSRVGGRPLIEEITPNGTKVPESDSMEIDSPTKTESAGITKENATESDAKPPVPSEPATLSFTLSIPTSVLSQLLPNAAIDDQGQKDGSPSSISEHVETVPSLKHPTAPIPRPLVHCAVEGCAAVKKYRVVVTGGEEKGACGLEHFRVLKGQVV